MARTLLSVSVFIFLGNFSLREFQVGNFCELYLHGFDVLDASLVLSTGICDSPEGVYFAFPAL